MNLARTALVVSTTFALLLGGVPAALAAPTPPVDLPELSGPAEPAATAGAPALSLHGGSGTDAAPAGVPAPAAAEDPAAGGLAGAASAGAHPTTV